MEGPKNQVLILLCYVRLLGQHVAEEAIDKSSNGYPSKVWQSRAVMK